MIPHRLYAGGNRLFETENEGQSWEAISPDLTTDDKSKEGPSGGPYHQRQFFGGILLHDLYGYRIAVGKRPAVDGQR
jgi:hypothetical protein